MLKLQSIVWIFFAVYAWGSGHQLTDVLLMMLLGVTCSMHATVLKRGR